ncbi:hypothetical protein [uncultured Sphingomonas sp.]|uniref:hypothetical protein n=1 Tax=uncultured Sphingomonas sp. TaxID=158754 RepID=UPI0025F68D47|nr:hypothetical protein [uncultured Sphingomonas sp.]
MQFAYFRLSTGQNQLSVRGGYMRRFGDGGVTSTFDGAPPEVTPFVTRSFLDRKAGTVDARLSGTPGHGLTAEVRYGGEYGARTTLHSLMGRLSVAF